MQSKRALHFVFASFIFLSLPAFGNRIGPAPVLLADEKPKGDAVDIAKLPKAVVDAVQKELPGARLTKAIKMADGNYLLSDVKVGRKEYTVTVSADGKILKREEDND